MAKTPAPVRPATVQPSEPESLAQSIRIRRRPQPGPHTIDIHDHDIDPDQILRHSRKRIQGPLTADFFDDP